MFQRSGRLIDQAFREYLLPTVMTSMAFTLAAVVDSVFVGNLLGSTALAATGVCQPLIYVINMIYYLFGVGGMTLASTACGQREFGRANQAFTVTLILGVTAMSVYVAVVLLGMDPIMRSLASGDASLAQLAAAYMTPLVFTGPAMMFSSGTSLFMRSDGRPKSSGMVVVAANIINLALDYVFMAWLGLGIMGAGLATTLGYAASIAFVVPYLRSKDRSFHFVRLARDWAKVLRDVASKGLTKALVQGTAFLRQLVMNLLVLHLFGSPGMSVMSTLLNVLMIATIFVNGTTDALLPIVGTLFGEQDYFGIRAAARSGARVVFGACITITAFFLIFPGFVGSWFGIVHSETADLFVPALRLFALYIPFMGAVYLLENLYTADDNVRISSTMAALDGLVFVLGFAFLLAYSGTVFWLCYACSGAATLAVAFLWASARRRKYGLRGLLLLPADESPGEVLNVETTTAAEPENAVQVSADIISFLTQHGVGQTVANRLGVCAEEMIVNTAAIAHAHHENGTIDVFVRVTPGDIILRFRDDGAIFDPATYEPGGIDGCTTDGIAVMKRLAEKTDYARQLGLNTTILTFSRSALRQASEDVPESATPQPGSGQATETTKENT